MYLNLILIFILGRIVDSELRTLFFKQVIELQNMHLSTSTVSFEIPPVRYDHSIRNDDVPSLRVTELSSSTFLTVPEDLKQPASTFRGHKEKIVRVHRVMVVKRKRPYQKIKSTNSETSKVNNIVAESRYVLCTLWYRL